MVGEPRLAAPTALPPAALDAASYLTVRQMYALKGRLAREIADRATKEMLRIGPRPTTARKLRARLALNVSVEVLGCCLRGHPMARRVNTTRPAQWVHVDHFVEAYEFYYGVPPAPDVVAAAALTTR